MKAVFHVGPHKTGSTAIQILTNENRGLFLQNFIYISEAYRKTSKTNPGNSWYMIYSSNATMKRLAGYHNSLRLGYNEKECENLHKICKQKFINDLQNAVNFEKKSSKPLTYFISSEEIVYLNQSEINSIYSLLLEFCDSIEILYYYRSPICRLRSDLQQASKGGFVHSNSLLAEIKPQDKLRIKRLLPNKENANALNITVKPYLKDLRDYKSWDIRNDFIDWLCEDKALKGKIMSKNSISNSAMSLQMFSILQDINKLMPTSAKDKTGYNKLRGFLHLAVEDYKWVKGVDTPFRLSQEDLNTLYLRKHEYGDFLKFCEDENVIDVDPGCRAILNHFLYEKEDAAEGVEGSIFDYKPELPRMYYINLICHLWTYLRKLELRKQKSAAISDQSID